jgi:hypothetical protein
VVQGNGFGDPLPVEEGAVEASKIAENPASVLIRELGVTPRDRQFDMRIELKVGLGVSADGEGGT